MPTHSLSCATQTGNTLPGPSGALRPKLMQDPNGFGDYESTNWDALIAGEAVGQCMVFDIL